MADKTSTKDDIKAKATQAADGATREAEKAAEKRKDQAGDGIDHIADRVHGVAEGLRDADEAWLSGYIDQAAEQLGEISESLKSRDMRTLVSDVETFARRNPALFLGASVAAGFALSRFARASERHPGDPHESAARRYRSADSAAYGAARGMPYEGPGGSSPYAYPSEPAPSRGGEIDETFAQGRARTGDTP